MGIVSVAGLFDLRVWETLAALAGTVATFAQSRATADPVDALTERLRHPVRWALTHPLQAARRFVRRRLTQGANQNPAD